VRKQAAADDDDNNAAFLPTEEELQAIHDVTRAAAKAPPMPKGAVRARALQAAGGGMGPAQCVRALSDASRAYRALGYEGRALDVEDLLEVLWAELTAEERKAAERR
jgi:hypothetical protein